MEEPTGVLGPPRIELQFGQLAFPRTWLVSTDEHRLVQLQSDRLVLNWRRLSGDQPYPRYTVLRELFSTLLGQLTDVLAATGSPVPAVNFCELSYINEIAVPGVKTAQPHPDLSTILDVVNTLKGRDFLPQAEDAQFQARWRIPAKQLPDGAPIGRLYLAVTPAFRADTQLPIYGLNLTSRVVPPPAADFGLALEILDIGHDWIVRGFADLTTKAMHDQWKVRV